MEKINVKIAFIISISRTANQLQRKTHFQKLKEDMSLIFEKAPEIYGVDGNNLTESNVISLINKNRLRPKITHNFKNFNFKKSMSTISKRYTHPLQKLVEMSINVYFKRNMLVGEVGCFLSHMGIIERIVREGIPNALILEDDAVLICSREQFGKKVNKLLQKFHDDFYVISLFQHEAQINDKCFKSNLREYDEDLYRVHPHSFGAVGYIISLKAAQYILKRVYPMKNPFDYDLFNEITKVEKGYLMKDPVLNVCLYDETTTRK